MKYKCKICGAPTDNELFCDECNKKYAAKADMGKPRLSLAPISALDEAVARVREYGIVKYPDPENWKTVSIDRYWDAFLRHVDAVREYGLDAIDPESKLPHIWHAACNLTFILSLMRRR